jgi:hypothetical protein
MGKTVVLDEVLCYLISHNDDEVFIFPRSILDPKLTELCCLKNSNENIKYLTSSPWMKNIHNFNSATSKFEEEVKHIILKSPRLTKVKIKKEEFLVGKSLWSRNEISRNEPGFERYEAVQRLFTLLSVFCWVSKSF